MRKRSEDRNVKEDSSVVRKGKCRSVRRDSGRVIRATLLKSRGCGCKSRYDH